MQRDARPLASLQLGYQPVRTRGRGGSVAIWRCIEIRGRLQLLTQCPKGESGLLAR